MDKKQAQKIIEDTFEHSFDKSRFTHFVRNLLNKIHDDPLTIKGNHIPEHYRQYVKTMDRIGTYCGDGDNSIDILVINLQKETSLERARTMQRNFIAWYLKDSKYGEEKNAVLAAFVSPDQDDWRFSLIKIEYRFEKSANGKVGAKEDFTPARRWSFLVGRSEKSHTAQRRLVDILADDEKNPGILEIEAAFDIESVTKEFFLKYRDLFLRTKEELDKVIKKDPKIKADFDSKGVDTVNFAKKLLGQMVFLYFLQKKGWFGVGRGEKWGTGSKQFLRQLFEKKHRTYKNFFNDILEPLFYDALRIDRSQKDDYYGRFGCKVPFLNGGLFDPIDNYDWAHTDLIIPDTLFSNSRKTKDGDIGDGILDVFDRYNFTVKEDEPLEKEVAIDPELLGKAYEKFNAIRSDNYAEFKKALKSGKSGDENRFNKTFGVYYTPREIVHHLCQQSLVSYLTTELSMDESGSGDGPISKHEFEGFIKAFKRGREGESAMSARIAESKTTRSIDSALNSGIEKNAKKIDEVLANITVCDPAVGSGAFPVGMMHEIVKARSILTPFLADPGRTIYSLKRHCIEKSLYGVDIDPGAVEIAKLRLWLSLIVDENDIHTVHPLPNLEYKIVRGNSLLGFPGNWTSPITKQIENLKDQLFGETNPGQKLQLKLAIDQKLNGRYRDSLKTFGYSIDFDFKTAFSEVFRKKDGFDVMIGNPPWGQKSVKFSKSDKEYMKMLYPSAMKGSVDIFRLFVDKSIQLTASKGVFANVLPDIVLLKNYATTRKYILDNLRLDSIDHWGMAFENVNIDSCTLIGKKTKNRGNEVLTTIHSEGNIVNRAIPQAQFLELEGYKFNLFLSPESLTIVNKLKEQGTFGRYFDPHEGIHSGNVRAKLFIKSKSGGLCHKLILGREEVKRYQLKWSGLWVNYDHKLIVKEKDEYAGLGKIEYFENPKIVVRRTGDFVLAALDENNYYFSNNVFVCLPKPNCELDLKYALGILNSKLATWCYRTIQPRKGRLFAELKINVLRQIPLKEPTMEEAHRIIELVDQVITLKKEQSNTDTFSIEREIDECVYKTFNLNSTEIMLIEKEHER